VTDRPTLAVLTERLGALHLQLADGIRDVITTPGQEPDRGVTSSGDTRLARDLDRLLATLREARRVFDEMLDGLSPDRRRANLQAIARLSRSHDEAMRDLHEAHAGLLDGGPIVVRVCLARAFHAIGHAEQMHYYLRLERAPAELAG
jgi:hypothetical protein